MAFDEGAKQLLEAVPAAITVLSPIFDDAGELQDLEVTWLNLSMRGLISDHVVAGLSLRKMYPLRDLDMWFALLLSHRHTNTIDRQYWNLDDKPGGDILEVNIRWWDDLLFLTATNTVPEKLGLSDALRAANVLSRALPSLNIAYAVRPDVTWLTFPTDGFLAAIGRGREEVLSGKLRDLMTPEDRIRLTSWVDLPEGERPHPFTFQTIGDVEQQRWLQLWSMSLDSDSPAAVEGIADNFIVLADIDDTRRASDAKDLISTELDKQLGNFTSALNASRDGFAMWQATRHDDGKCTYRLMFMNAAGAEPTGKTPASLIGQRIEDIMGDGQFEGLVTLFSSALDTRKIQIDTVSVNSRGAWVGEFENTVVPFGHDRVVTTFRDVTEYRLEQDRLIWLSEHDHLTGLPNRRNLEVHLGLALTQARESGTPAGFVFIDIDNFKLVNDTWGHDVGDLLLQDFVVRLESSLGHFGMVARLAGDEFAAVLNNVASDKELSAILDGLMAEVRRPFDLQNSSVAITCSAGAVTCSGDEKITDILLTTDKAMYRAKHAGKNRYHIAPIATS